MSEEHLQSTHEPAHDEALKAFDAQHFGRQHAKKSVDQLDDQMKEDIADYPVRNLEFDTWSSLIQDGTGLAGS
ncbi:hypothetical protein HID58_052121 [Brassica napus]|uniref:BnaC03g21470D protein n=3 Tax=Brassica TaxID=3705 RepID=A0A078FQ27_BRANA|nr:hypothetical protein HID58_052121 [Brassica napus]CAF1700553.1 unnamed protein product [Brassica napus]CDY14448.1 BnaC03g21470D [Brassica napus]VDC89605.1 unnamed protein product [Brassica oleracea]